MTAEKILTQSFLDYSAFILQRRALPDVRDGLKFTGRQILHAQHREKLDHKHPAKKSQKSVAAATGFSYVHGDMACYEQIIKMGRPLVQRYFLESITGNGGTPTGSDTYAASRYTECRLSPLSGAIFKYLDALSQDDWLPTYDEEGVFPTVLPTVGFYNICNGSFGSIGVGLVSSIPQFNLAEMNEEICKVIDNPEYIPDLLPDFASGGILLNPNTARKSLAAGHGKSLLLRGEITKNPKEGYLTVKNLPYGVYTNLLCNQLAEAMNAYDEEKGPKPPFTDFKDLSTTKVDFRIYSKNLDVLEAWLYKNTCVQKNFSVQMTMLDGAGKVPRVFSLKQAIDAHILHASSVFRTQFENTLKILKDAAEVMEGLIKAFSIIDEVIGCIRASKDRSEAIKNLVAGFDFTTPQATAICDMKMHRLTKIDIVGLKSDLEININEQKRINSILTNQSLFNDELKTQYSNIAKEFSDKRRTVIYAGDDFESAADGEVLEHFFIETSPIGYNVAISEQDEIFTKTPTPCKSEDKIILISTEGRSFLIDGKDLKAGLHSWSEILKLNKNESIVMLTTREVLQSHEYLVFHFNDDTTTRLHVSFINPASKRGKKIFKKAIEIKEIEWG